MCPLGTTDHAAARPPIRLIRPSSNSILEGPSADSEEKREPLGDINTATMNSLKALDTRPVD